MSLNSRENNGQAGGDPEVCTLFERDYHYGVAALINSLFHKGFLGIFWAGYKGDLPFWASGAESRGAYMEKKIQGITIRFVEIKENVFLNNYKPQFMRMILQTLSQKCESLFYFDSDILIKAPWDFFEKWIEHGIAVCEDMIEINPLHPIRLIIKKFYEDQGFSFLRECSYINSGCVGVKRGSIDLLESWEAMMQKSSGLGYSMTSFSLNAPKAYGGLFFITDQCFLTLALMRSSRSFSMLGPEGMGFDDWGNLTPMLHGIGKPKPWENKNIAVRYLRTTILPGVYSLFFWRYTDFPIRLYPGWYSRYKFFEMKILRFLSRFYK